MSDSERVRVNLDDVCVGAKCKYDVCDDSGLLLLARGHVLTDLVRDQIRGRDVSFLEVHPDDVAGLLGKAQDKTKRPKSAKPEKEPKRVDRRGESYSKERSERYSSLVTSAVGAIKSIGEHIDSLSASSISTLCEIPLAMTEMALEDSDQAIAALNDESDLSLAQRSARLALLAMCTGLEMDLSDGEVLQLGLAGLLHDFGLYRMPPEYRNPTATFSANEAWEYRKHPTVAMELFSDYTMIPDEVPIIINQVHERIDGSGYPRGLRAPVIHPLARVLNVVDTYIGMIDPGPGRPAILPHDAIGFLLHEGGRGRLDGKAIRAFLTTVTLFPIGSRVELSDGQTGTVIRRDGNHYSQPIIQPDDRSDGPVEINTHDAAMAIKKPLVDTNRKQMRLSPELMQSLTLEMLQPAC